MNLVGTVIVSLFTKKPEQNVEEELNIVKEEQKSISKVLVVSMTENTSKALELESKGKLEKDYDADLLIINKDNFKLNEVFMKGRQMMSNGAVVVKGTFE